MSGQTDAEIEIAALRRGRSEGLATAALALGALAFLNLLGAEKGILAVVLGVLALRHVSSGQARRRAQFAVVLGALQIATVALVLVLFHDQLRQLIDLLRTLG
jgi:hypothetical protein